MLHDIHDMHDIRHIQYPNMINMIKHTSWHPNTLAVQKSKCSPQSKCLSRPCHCRSWLLFSALYAIVRLDVKIIWKGLFFKAKNIRFQRLTTLLYALNKVVEVFADFNPIRKVFSKILLSFRFHLWKNSCMVMFPEKVVF